jgi:hypothetical protein
MMVHAILSHVIIRAVRRLDDTGGAVGPWGRGARVRGEAVVVTTGIGVGGGHSGVAPDAARLQLAGRRGKHCTTTSAPHHIQKSHRVCTFQLVVAKRNENF